MKFIVNEMLVWWSDGWIKWRVDVMFCWSDEAAPNFYGPSIFCCFYLHHRDDVSEDEIYASSCRCIPL